MCVRSMHEKLAANAVPVQLPIGAENSFIGVVDVVRMKAYVWNSDKLGTKYEIQEIPENLLEKAKKAHQYLIEKVADYDDALMEKFLEGKEISEKELVAAVRKATITATFCPVLCGSAYKN